MKAESLEVLKSLKKWSFISGCFYAAMSIVISYILQERGAGWMTVFTAAGIFWYLSSRIRGIIENEKVTDKGEK